VVGGAVRNALLGRPISDIDIATTATPGEVIAAAAAASLKSIPTGIAHGTVTILANGEAIEVTTLRADVETDGRHAQVAFSKDWSTDAHRRDFTINALYCSADGTVHDLVGGMADIAARRVRFIGDASSRIREDYLRILRLFRFHAAFGEGPIDAAELAAAIAGRDGLGRLSGERIAAELRKLLLAPGAAAAIRDMAESGLLTLILRAAPRPGVLETAIAVEAAAGLPGDAMLRLSALAIAVEEDAERLTEGLKLSNEERAALVPIALGSDLTPGLGAADRRRRLYRLGASGWQRAALSAWIAEGNAADPAWLELLHLPEAWPIPRLPVRGADLVAAGIPAGPQIGEMLARLETYWLEEDFRPDRDQLLARIGEDRLS
jgi:poly(A) polymerase